MPIPFLFVTLTFNIFCTNLPKSINLTNILGQMKKIEELWNHIRYSYTSFIKW